MQFNSMNEDIFTDLLNSQLLSGKKLLVRVVIFHPNVSTMAPVPRVQGRALGHSLCNVSLSQPRHQPFVSAVKIFHKNILTFENYFSILFAGHSHFGGHLLRSAFHHFSTSFSHREQPEHHQSRHPHLQYHHHHPYNTLLVQIINFMYRYNIRK